MSVQLQSKFQLQYPIIKRQFQRILCIIEWQTVEFNLYTISVWNSAFNFDIYFLNMKNFKNNFSAQKHWIDTL